MIWILTGALAILVIVVWILGTRSQQNQLVQGFSILKESFDSLQKNLLLLQEKTERTQASLSQDLRAEVLQEMQRNRSELKQDLSQTTQCLEERVAKLSLGVTEKLELNLKEGFLHFVKVEEHLRQAGLQLQNLNSVGESIHELNNVLKLPHLRGEFGEATLERILSDTMPADAFELQYCIVPNSTERVDAVIKMPQYLIPIDSKFPREQILPIFEAAPSNIEQARKQLSDIMRTLAKQIRDKYVHPEHGTSEMALLFIPSETIYFECLRNPKLCDDLSRLKVFPVSPHTLSITLHSISFARGYYDMAKGVEKTIAELKKAQTHYQNFETRFDEIGKALTKAQDAYHTAHTHLNRYQGAVTRLGVGGHENSENLPTH